MSCIGSLKQRSDILNLLFRSTRSIVLSLLHCHLHEPPALPASAISVPPARRPLCRGTYNHHRQHHPNRNEHRRGDGAFLVGVVQAVVAAVEAPLVRANRAAVQNQAGHHSYTYTHMNECMTPHAYMSHMANPTYLSTEEETY